MIPPSLTGTWTDRILLKKQQRLHFSSSLQIAPFCSFHPKVFLSGISWSCNRRTEILAQHQFFLTLSIGFRHTGLNSLQFLSFKTELESLLWLYIYNLYVCFYILFCIITQNVRRDNTPITTVQIPGNKAQHCFAILDLNSGAPLGGWCGLLEFWQNTLLWHLNLGG